MDSRVGTKSYVGHSKVSFEAKTSNRSGKTFYYEIVFYCSQVWRVRPVDRAPAEKDMYGKRNRSAVQTGGGYRAP